MKTFLTLVVGIAIGVASILAFRQGTLPDAPIIQPLLTDHAPPPERERFPVRCTWYGRRYAGRLCADGVSRFRPEEFTAAHATLPFGTRVKVEWLGRIVTVVINDRPANGIDVLDLSSSAFRGLAPLRIGVIHGVAEVVR